MNFSELKEIFHKYYSSDTDIDSVIQKLKESGASQMESVWTISRELGISLPEADKIVIHSASWAESLEATKFIRSSFERFLDESQDGNESGDQND